MEDLVDMINSRLVDLTFLPSDYYGNDLKEEATHPKFFHDGNRRRIFSEIEEKESRNY